MRNFRGAAENVKKNFKKYSKKNFLLTFFFQKFFKTYFFKKISQNLFVKYFFIIFGKNFKSLAPKMAELLELLKKKFNFFFRNVFKKCSTFFVIRYRKSKNSG